MEEKCIEEKGGKKEACCFFRSNKVQRFIILLQLRVIHSWEYYTFKKPKFGAEVNVSRVSIDTSWGEKLLSRSTQKFNYSSLLKS